MDEDLRGASLWGRLGLGDKTFACYSVGGDWRGFISPACPVGQLSGIK